MKDKIKTAAEIVVEQAIQNLESGKAQTYLTHEARVGLMVDKCQRWFSDPEESELMNLAADALMLVAALVPTFEQEVHPEGRNTATPPTTSPTRMSDEDLMKELGA